jgi:asparagine synthase (glutamine-hydrolysing)
MSVRTDEGAVTITYSGETYDFVELRDELRRRGHRFRTRSDTEVVLHGYLEWGEAVAERLNGMYALAIWDARVDKLVMTRDRMGIKPLYLYPTADGVLFGSEPKAILANPLADHAVDLDCLRELLSFTKTPGHAVWSGMREVLPGTVVTVNRTGIRQHHYWTLRTRPHTDDQHRHRPRAARGHRGPPAGRRRSALRTAVRWTGLQCAHRTRRRPTRRAR